MKETHSGKAVSSHSKRKNVVLSLVFCVAAVCVALLVLVGPGHSLAGAAQRSGVDAALPASIDTTTSDNTAQPTADSIRRRSIVRRSSTVQIYR
mgnify:CR=1 FL=1